MIYTFKDKEDFGENQSWKYIDKPQSAKTCQSLSF